MLIERQLLWRHKIISAQIKEKLYHDPNETDIALSLSMDENSLFQFVHPSRVYGGSVILS